MLETQKIPYALGIDVGSTTVKTVLLTEMGEVLSSSYERHFSKVRETVCTKLASLAQEYPDVQLRVSITGSAGLGLAQAAGLPFVQEVHAAFLAVKRRYPEADVVIELGGEDAKIIFLTGGVEQRMNGSCAGGTGAFIDQMATLLDVSVDQLDKMAQAAEKVYPIASRCGVFAKSDIQPLLNQGARREDIAASIFQAVVDQTVSGLAQGRRLPETCCSGRPAVVPARAAERLYQNAGTGRRTRPVPRRRQNLCGIRQCRVCIVPDGYIHLDRTGRTAPERQDSDGSGGRQAAVQLSGGIPAVSGTPRRP